MDEQRLPLHCSTCCSTRVQAEHHSKILPKIILILLLGANKTLWSTSIIIGFVYLEHPSIQQFLHQINNKRAICSFLEIEPEHFGDRDAGPLFCLGVQTPFTFLKRS